jgi:hypothetical protein
VRLCGIWTGVAFARLHLKDGPSGKIRRMMYELQYDVDCRLKTSSKRDFWPTNNAPTLAWPMFSLRGPQSFLLKSQMHSSRTWRSRRTRRAALSSQVSTMSSQTCRAAAVLLRPFFVYSKPLACQQQRQTEALPLCSAHLSLLAGERIRCAPVLVLAPPRSA